MEPPRLRALVREMKDRRQFANLPAELNRLFREMDATYNSELFSKHLVDTLDVTPSVLEEVIEGLYERNFVYYNFNAIESDVLGRSTSSILAQWSPSRWKTFQRERRCSPPCCRSKPP